MKVNYNSENRYFLFEGTKHDDLNLDFRKETIEKFHKLWDMDLSLRKICGILKIKEAEGMLIMIDLGYAGLLREREYEFWQGTQVSPMMMKELEAM